MAQCLEIGLCQHLLDSLVTTWQGLVTYYVLVMIDLATHQVQITGITPHPMSAFMQQCARQLTDPFDGFLLGKRYLIHDRDTEFIQMFDGLLRSGDFGSVK